jgi:uncharacterized DUF497 family protein
VAIFRWIGWNRDKIARHGVSPAEAEHVVNRARRPYPKRAGDDKWIVIGSAAKGRQIQVVFLYDDDERSDEDTIFVIHARPLTDAEKRRQRRRKRP